MDEIKSQYEYRQGTYRLRGKLALELRAALDMAEMVYVRGPGGFDYDTAPDKLRLVVSGTGDLVVISFTYQIGCRCCCAMTMTEGAGRSHPIRGPFPT